MSVRSGFARTFASVIACFITALITLSACSTSSQTLEGSPPNSAPSSNAATQALTSVIRGLDAAIYGYGIVGSHLSGTEQRQAKKAQTVLNRQRVAFILAVGAQVNPEAVAYQIPFPVTDSTSAKKLAAMLEVKLIPLFTTAAQVTTGPIKAATLLAKTQASARAATWAETPAVPYPTEGTLN